MYVETEDFKPKSLISPEVNKSPDATEQFRKSPYSQCWQKSIQAAVKKICVAVINLCGIFLLSKVLDISVSVKQ